MKEIVIKSVYAVRKTIDPYRRQYNFELFGYDFILDENFNTWLIEVNTNPCLEESSQLLKDLIPRMVEDMFQLTIDKIFPKNFLKKKRVHTNKDAGMSSPVKIKNRKSSALAGPPEFGTATKTLQRSRQSFSSKGRKLKKSRDHATKTQSGEPGEGEDDGGETEVKIENGGDMDGEREENTDRSHTDGVAGDDQSPALGPGDSALSPSQMEPGMNEMLR